MSNARDGLYRRPGSPYWWMTWTDAAGKRRWASTRKLQKGEAERVLRVERTKADRGELPAEGRGRIDDLFPEYMREMSAAGQRNAQGKQEHFDSWIGPIVGRVALRDLKPSHMRTIRDQMTAEGRKAATVNRVWATLRHFVSWAVMHDPPYCSMEVRNRVRSVQNVKEPAGRVRYLTPKEAKRLVKACPEPLRSVVLAALYTGARRGELVGHRHAESLKWSEVDLEAGFITFSRTKSGKARFVPIAEPLRKVLKALPRSVTCDAVFIHQRRGDALTWRDVRDSWEAAIVEARIEDFHVHDLRHTAASWMVMSGVPIYTVQVILGHSIPQVTQRYAHLAPESLRPAVEKIAAGVSGRDIYVTLGRSRKKKAKA